MIQITAIVAACIVVLQATCVFMGNGDWTFLMAKATPDAATWQSAMQLIHTAPNHSAAEDYPPPMNSWRVTSYANSSESSLVYCLQSTFLRTAYCLQHAHTPHAAEQVMQAWNPHVLLLGLACLHLHITLGPFAPPYISPMLLALLSVAAVIDGLRDSAFMQYPSILGLVLIALGGAWFTHIVSRYAHDARWRMAAHLQLVCVPLAVLGIAVAGGARLWSDALAYFVLFSGAVNCLWVQSTLRGALALSLCRAFTIALTVVPLRIANDAFGAYDTWRYVIAYVACAGLAPIVLLSLFPTPTDAEDGGGKVHRQPHASGYFDVYYYLYGNYFPSAWLAAAAPPQTEDDAEPNQAYAQHHILLQIFTCAALLGLSANLAFAFESRDASAAVG